MKKPHKVDKASNPSAKKAPRKATPLSKTSHGTLGLLSQLDLSKRPSPQSSNYSNIQSIKAKSSPNNIYPFNDIEHKSRRPESILKVDLPSIIPHVKLKSYNAHIQRTVTGLHETIRDRFANLDDLKHSGSLGQSYIAPQHLNPTVRNDHQSSMIPPFNRHPSIHRPHHARRFSTTPRNTNPMDEDPWDDYYHTDGEGYIVLDDDFVRDFDTRTIQGQSSTSGGRSKRSSRRKRQSDSEKPLPLDPNVVKSVQQEPKVAPLHERIGKTVNPTDNPSHDHRAHHFIEYSAVSVVPKTDNRAATDTEKVFPQHSMIAGTSNMNRLASMYGSGFLHKRLFDPKEAEKYAHNQKKQEKSAQKSEVRKKKRFQSAQSESDISYSMHGKRHMSTWTHLWNGVRNFSIVNRNTPDEDKPAEEVMNRSINKPSRIQKAHIDFSSRIPDQLELPSIPQQTQTTSVEYGYSGFEPSHLVPANKADDRRQHSTKPPPLGSSKNQNRIISQEKPRYKPKVQGREWD